MPRVRESEQVTQEQMERFSDWLRQTRIRRDLTQDQMARELDMSVSYYNALENSRKKATKHRLYEIAKALNDLSIIEHLFDSETLTRLRKEDGAKRLLESPLSSDESDDVFDVPVSPVLTWWGYSPRHIAKVRHLSDLEEVKQGQLLYVAENEFTEGFFMFASFEDPETPMMETPETVIARYFCLDYFHEMEEFGLDPKKVGQRLPMIEARWKIYVVVALFEPADEMDFDSPLVHPAQRELSPESKRQLIEQAIFIHRLELRLKNRPRPPLTADDLY